MKKLLLIATLLATAPAFAQWPSDKPKTDSKPADTATPPPPPPPAKKASHASSEDDGSGFSLGVRAAFAWPYGGLDDSTDVAQVINNLVPVRIDAGYWINRNIYVGLYGHYGFAFSNCNLGRSCSAHDLNFGIEGIYNLAPTQMIQPWVGLGFGYEILNLNSSGDETTFKGLELGNVELGFDFAPSKNMTIGVFGAVPIYSKYTSFSANGQSNDIGNQVVHRW